MIKDANKDDATTIARIYNHYITHTTCTFEESEVDADEMWTRIRDVRSAGLPWIVNTEDDQLTGYAYASKWKARSAYRFSVEVTVYLCPDSLRRGAGTALYEALFERLRKLGINSAVGGVTLPNEASIALHEKMGMCKVAHFKHVGFKFGQWLDVGYWQTNLLEDEQPHHD